MAATAALQRIDRTRRTVRRIYRISFTGSYANNGTTGDVVDMTTATNPNNLERSLLSEVPGSNRISILHANLPGFIAYLNVGTTLATLIGVRIFRDSGAAAAFTEIANGAYAAAITGGFVDVAIDSRW